jgi:hypothetical protein
VLVHTGDEVDNEELRALLAVLPLCPQVTSLNLEGMLHLFIASVGIHSPFSLKLQRTSHEFVELITDSLSHGQTIALTRMAAWRCSWRCLSAPISFQLACEVGELNQHFNLCSTHEYFVWVV